jgi:hypothetical protein
MLVFFQEMLLFNQILIIRRVYFFFVLCFLDIGCEQLGLYYNERLMSVGVNRRDYKEWARKFAALG